MATISQTKETTASTANAQFDLDIAGWFRNNVFNNIWTVIFVLIFLGADILILRASYNAEPVGLSFNLAPNGVPTPLGNLILILTNGALLTSTIFVLWVAALIWVVYCAARHHWPGPSHWLKDSLFSGAFSTLTTLGLSVLVVFAMRGALSWAVFGAEFRSDPEQVGLLRSVTPGAIWGVVTNNLKLFTVFRYPIDLLWRVYASLGIILVLAMLSTLAWSFGSPLKRYRQALVWAWLASTVVIGFLLRGFPNQATGPWQGVATTFWGGLLLTMVLAVVGIVVSFPIGVLLALGRRSEIRGVPFMWLWGAIALLLYWLFGNFPTEPVTLNIPVLFRDPPIWVVTVAPLTYAILQAIVVITVFWIIGHYLKGNLIKTFCIVYIEVIRGVPLITVLFMANIMLPIFLPKGFDVDNLIRVMVGVIMFSAAYQAENVRGGLQAIPTGQYEAAMAVGLSTAKSMRLIILPQALRAVIPAIVGPFIGLFKDTSLVSIVGLIDLVRVAQIVVAQPAWLGLHKETFAFVALVYWVFAFSMSQASQRLERRLGVGQY